MFMNDNQKFTGWLADLRCLNLKFYYIVRHDADIGWFLGPEVRGSIGRQLKEYKGCFADRDQDCQICSPERRQNCAYHACFQHGGNSPKGFFLKIDPAYRGMRSHFERGDSFYFDFVLTGSAMLHAPFILDSLMKTRLRLGDHGFSPQAQDCGWLNEEKSFVSVRSAVTVPVSGYPLACTGKQDVKRVTLHFLTPAEITLKHGQVLRNPRDLSFRLLMVRIFQKIKRLDANGSKCSSPGSVSNQEADFLFATAEKIILADCQARWQQIPLRQSGKRRCGGLVGSITYQGDLVPSIPFLQTACYFGLGKGATLGLGHVTFEIGG